MTQIYLIRHAEAEGNLYRRIHGQYNSKITMNGMRQIEALKGRFADTHIDAVYSSDLRRTMTTARSVYVPKGLTLHTDPRLREVAMGVWEDKPWGEVEREDPEGMAQFNRSDPDWKNQGGESFAELLHRVREAVLDIAHRHPDQTVAIFCHGTAIRTLIANLHGLSIGESAQIRHGDNTCVALLTAEGDTLQVVYENDNSHLPEEISTFARQRWWRTQRDGVKDYNLWFRPWDAVGEAELYCAYRADAWHSIHGIVPYGQADAFYAAARQQSAAQPEAVCLAMSGDRPVGIIQLDLECWKAERTGMISFCYLIPEFRNHGLGVQLIGQAVSVLRRGGYEQMRLRCAPDNGIAQRFYRRYGFVPLGEVPDSVVPLQYLQAEV